LLEDFEALIKEFKATFGTRPASSYASEFRQIVSDLNWGEAAMIDQFRTGLKNKAIRTKAEMFKGPNLGKRFKPSPSNYMNPLTEPMQIDTLRYKPLLDEEKNQRHANRLCLYCGEQGYIAKAAPATVRGLRLKQDVNSTPRRPSTRFPTNALTIGLSLHLSDGSKVNLAALIDSGVSACFLDIAFAKQHNIPFQVKKTSLTVKVIDSREIFSGNVMHEMGLTWLALHNPTINWCNRLITFSDPSCKAQCLNILTSNPHQAQTYVVQVFTALASSSYPTEIHVISEKYQDYSDIFNKKEANKLPESWPHDCTIDLLPDKQPLWGPIYGLTTKELEKTWKKDLSGTSSP
ncbi:588_t:CDS:2, partial [Cetraspora pellucida]